VTDLQKIVVSAGLSALVAGGGAVVAMQRQVDRVEVRQEEQYKALQAQITAIGQRTREGHDEIRVDLSGIRAEILGILKERR
jgi:hypothetical protein